MVVKRPVTASVQAPAPCTREAILQAARRRLAAGEELSIGAVAAEAGVSRQTVHAHFGGAKGLLAELAAEGLAVPAPDEPTRERLIDAAVRVLSQPGGGLISIEAISAEAGLTKGAFYHHFADRGELFRAAAQRISPIAELQACLEANEDAPARESLVAMARTYYDFIRARADLVRNLAVNSTVDPEYTQVVMSEIVGKGAPLIFAWYVSRVGRGELRPINPALMVQMLLGPAFMLVVMGTEMLDEMARRGIQPAIQDPEAYVDLVLEGIAADPTPDPNARPSIS